MIFFMNFHVDVGYFAPSRICNLETQGYTR